MLSTQQTDTFNNMWTSRLFLAILLALSSGCERTPANNYWPDTTNEHKPWTRWWWHGSALTRDGITRELEAYSRAGLGGVEITPIYGVHGYEDKFVQFLSPEWMGLLLHTLKEAKRLGLGVDMATGTGWPFGGPWVDEAVACKNMYHKVYSLKGGQKLKEKVAFVQPPFLRAVGSQVYEVHDSFGGEPVKPEGTRKDPLMKYDPKTIRIGDIRQPVASNEDLQSLALDQVQFEKQLPLVALIAYEKKGDIVNLTSRVNDDGELAWVAPTGEWQLYAIFEGQHGKMVERAGPGGEGNVIDHFSRASLSNYLKKFDSAFSGNDITSLRAFFNDSYEVDDARGAADWTPALLDEFSNRRGYSLLEHLPELFGSDSSDLGERIFYDYRLTISELLLENFTQPWAAWAHGKKKIVRNQAHGAPANILDLYAAVDIPETEGVEPVRFKMATSAAHVTGKQLASSESATWLDEHFLSNLGDIKSSVDNYLMQGVNHIFYHGTSYSPPDEPWPGWLFYASVHLNPRNPQWKDFAALNRYIARCQGILQQGTPDSDVLLYYPIADRFSERGPEMVEHFDSPSNNFKNSSFLDAAYTMLANDYTFDYISDSQLLEVKVTGDMVTTSGGSQYRSIVVPHCKYLPLETLSKLVSLAREGANILFVDSFPETVAGFGAGRLEQFNLRMDELKDVVSPPASLTVLLSQAGVRHEALAQHGISFVRRKIDGDRTVYLVRNDLETPFDGRIPLATTAKFGVIRDPMTSLVGNASMVREGATTIRLQLQPGQTLFIELTGEEPALPEFPLRTVAGGATVLRNWTIDFIEGGPTLPASIQIDSAAPWTSMPAAELKAFSGTAVYGTIFTLPGETAGDWILRLGDVHESATIYLNGDSIATLMAPPFDVVIDGSSLNSSNKLEVHVSNLMANRISDLDRKGVAWKKFYNVNFPSRKPENRVNGLFNSAHWPTLTSGLVGPVSLGPVAAAQAPN